MMNFGAGSGHQVYLKNIRRPAAILVGSADEQELADQFAPYLQRLDVNIPVTIVPDMKHTDMTSAPGALPIVVRMIASRE
jgi:pimeloyl-ACP methyl ester carboxylesterase